MLECFNLSWTPPLFSICSPIHFIRFFSYLSITHLTVLKKTCSIFLITNKVSVFPTHVWLPYISIFLSLSVHFLSLYIVLMFLLQPFLPPLSSSIVPWRVHILINLFVIMDRVFFQNVPLFPEVIAFLVWVLHQLLSCYISFLLSLL